MTTILIGVDASARSEDAIAFARALAPAATAELVVATVVHDPAAPGSPAHDEAYATTRRMSGLLAGVEAERIRMGVVESRSPAQGLHELAAAESAVCGHGRIMSRCGKPRIRIAAHSGWTVQPAA